MNHQSTTVQSLSTPDLLAMLVGQEKATAFSQTPLSVIFGLRADRQTSTVCEDKPQYARRNPLRSKGAGKARAMRGDEPERNQFPIPASN